MRCVCDLGISLAETTPSDPEHMEIAVVDIFAGPGGLGEGFSAFSPSGASGKRPFRIVVSAEMDQNASRTLRLRAFFRMFARGHAPASYYQYVAGRRGAPWSAATAAEWHAAGEEALRLQLGRSADDDRLYSRISQTIRKDRTWVLIGGPPCQAYSLVGRARNKGIHGYRAEADGRHFLYRQYLRVIQHHAPAAFVMENVKGILSSRVNGALMFPRILDDLSRPGGRHGPRYNIMPVLMTDGTASAGYSPKDFVLRAEDFGVPQTRHRVVLLGVAEGISLESARLLRPLSGHFATKDVIGGLPGLRSNVTDLNVDKWPSTAADILYAASRAARAEQPLVSQKLSLLAAKAARRKGDPGSGGQWMSRTGRSDKVPAHLAPWLLDRNLDGILNHEVRAHMTGDLMRYAYASTFAATHGYSPRGSGEFPKTLHPSHRNWGSGKFVDRFKVQLGDQPSSTITSHLSKDGHYFIHPDPSQFRSLSVREAARLQTFPDNYFFEGSRGAQFKQVGNAVPPWLARQIASTVYSILAGR